MCQHTAIKLINHVSYVKLNFSIPLKLLLDTCRLEHIKQAWRWGFIKKKKNFYQKLCKLTP